MDPSVSFGELEKRRQKVQERRQSTQPAAAPPPPQYESEALAVISEIFNPSFQKPVTEGQYTLPEEMKGDPSDLQNYDLQKLAELKEVFALFDTDMDGLISKDDLRFTFTALGAEAPEGLLDEMLQEAKDPLDYPSFVALICKRTVELDSEEVLLEAWSKWDDYGTGKVDEKKMYIELTNYGDKLSKKEADEALKHAPLAKPKSLEEPSMIDYPAFCRQLCGLRKRNEN